MVKPNRTPEEEAVVREEHRKADKEASFLFHYQMAQDMAAEEQCINQPKPPLDIQSDGKPKEETPPILIADEEGIVGEILPK